MMKIKTLAVQAVPALASAGCSWPVRARSRPRSTHSVTHGPRRPCFLRISGFIGDLQQRRKLDEEMREASRHGDSSGRSAHVLVDPIGFKPNQTLIMSSEPTPAGSQQPMPDSLKGRIVRTTHALIDNLTQVRVVEGEVDPCEPVPASDGEAPIRAPKGGRDFSEVPYAGLGLRSRTWARRIGRV